MTRLAMLSMFALAACGGDDSNGHLADAPESDAALPAGVIVTVTLDGQPTKGQTVYFQDHTQATTVTQVTGDDGNATAMVEAGGYVTVIEPEPPPAPSAIGANVHLSTFVGVQPGDHLYVDVQGFGADLPGVTFKITVPNELLGYDYYLQSSCGSSYIGRGNGLFRAPVLAAGDVVSNTVTLHGCGGTADLLVLGRQVEGLGVRSWGYKANTALTEGGEIVFDTLASATDLAFTYSHPATAITGVDINRELRSPRGSLFFDGTFAGLDEAGDYTATLGEPVPPGTLAITTSAAEATEGFGQHTVVTWGAATEGVTADFTALQLHPYTGIPTFDPASHTITWSDGAAGAAPDFVVGLARAARNDAGTLRPLTWRIVAPYVAGQTKLVYPTLPTTLYDFTFKATDTPVVDSLTTVKLGAGGYDAARPHVFTSSLAGLAAGPTGQLVAEDMFFAPINQIRGQIRGQLRKPVRSAVRAPRGR